MRVLKRQTMDDLTAATADSLDDLAAVASHF